VLNVYETSLSVQLAGPLRKSSRNELGVVPGLGGLEGDDIALRYLGEFLGKHEVFTILGVEHFDGGFGGDGGRYRQRNQES
jgi:hypothetical protein